MFWVVWSKIHISIFTSQKSSRTLRRYLCRPLINWGRIRKKYDIYQKYSTYIFKPHDFGIVNTILLIINHVQRDWLRTQTWKI